MGLYFCCNAMRKYFCHTGKIPKIVQDSISNASNKSNMNADNSTDVN